MELIVFDCCLDSKRLYTLKRPAFRPFVLHCQKLLRGVDYVMHYFVGRLAFVLHGHHQQRQNGARLAIAVDQLVLLRDFIAWLMWSSKAQKETFLGFAWALMFVAIIAESLYQVFIH